MKNLPLKVMAKDSVQSVVAAAVVLTMLLGLMLWGGDDVIQGVPVVRTQKSDHDGGERTGDLIKLREQFSRLGCSQGNGSVCRCSGLGWTALPHDFYIFSRCVVLDLSLNSLRHIPNNTFQIFNRLQTLNLRSNKLTTLDRFSLAGLANLTRLDISKNRLTEIPNGVFSDLDNLKRLDLCANNLAVLNNDSFVGLRNLVHLDLQKNFLQMSYPVHAFLPFASSLRVLKINENNLKIDKDSLQYPVQSLVLLVNLVELEIDGLSNKSLCDVDFSWNNLRSLSFSSGNETFCNLNSLDNDSLKCFPNLEVLNVSSCRMISNRIGDQAFASISNLTTLDLSNNIYIGMNNLTRLLGSTRLEKLYINYIVPKYSLSQRLTYNDTQWMPDSLQYLEARGNSLETLDCNIFKALPPNLTHLDLGENDFSFGPYLLNISEMSQVRTLILDGSDKAYLFLQMFPKGNKCSKPRGEKSCSGSDSEISSGFDENDSIETEIDTQENIDIDRLPFPANLSILSINNADLNYVLNRVAIDSNNILTELYLDGNNFPELNGPMLGFHKLKILSLRNCRIRHIGKQFFEHMPSLERLDISSNFIGVSLWGGNEVSLFRDLTSLKILNISYNSIEHISFHSRFFDGLDEIEEIYIQTNRLWQFGFNISSMNQLRVLNLSDTSMISLTPEIRQQVDKILNVHGRRMTIDMSGNPIACTCDNLDFIEWMVVSQALDESLSTQPYFCAFQVLFEFINVTDRYEQIMAQLRRECNPHFAIFLSTIAGTCILVSIIVGLIAYRFRWKLRYVYYAAYLSFKGKITPHDLDDYPYDAFVSYSNDDEIFVLQTLAKELGDRGVKLLVHGRDFVAGEYIASNIIAAIKESRKTLVVLTTNLLRSSWCKYELQMANMESVHTGRQVLIFLLKESIPNKDLGVDVLDNLRQNTYIPYPLDLDMPTDGDFRAFWDKLARDITS
ncbi:hypothetical protein Btru_063782 [Bulinus truncatus]|nr:hypothetical protein Btru_063782 [Bulinus truncatus]